MEPPDEDHEFVPSEEFAERLQDQYPGLEALTELSAENPGVLALYMLTQGQILCKQLAVLSSCAVAMMAKDPRMTPEWLLRQLADELEANSAVYIDLRGALSKIIRLSADEE